MSIVTRFIRLLQNYGNLSWEYRKDVFSLIEPNPNARLLDLGCGDGEFTLKVAQKIGTSHVLGIDGGKENVEQAKAKGINCYQADLDEAKFPFEDKSFDVVCASQIIEHLSNTDGFIKEIHRVLKPGGYAVISTPNLAAWHCIIFLLLGWQPEYAHISDENPEIGRPMIFAGSADNRMLRRLHRRIFTLRALRELLEYHRFHFERSVGSGFLPFPALPARLLSRLDKRHASVLTIKARRNYPQKG